MTSLGTLTLIASLAVTQADAPSKHLQVLQPLIGQWVHTGPLQSDTPTLGPKGTEFTAIGTYTWAINKTALRIDWVAKSKGREPVRFVELVGWDPKQEKLVSQGFGSAGHVENNVWSCEDGVVICDTQGVDADGQGISLRYLHVFEGETMTMKMVDLKVEGEDQPDEVYEYRRVR